MLITELMAPEPSGIPLISEAVTGDGLWHHIGLVWDGSNRMVYVDGVSVAADTQDSLAGSFYGFRIGAGENMQPQTFFASV